MTKEAAEILKNYHEGYRFGVYCKISKNYSGRGMFGRTTFGIIIDGESELFQALSEIMVSGDEEEREIIAEWLCNMKSDNMGLQMIFY